MTPQIDLSGLKDIIIPTKPDIFPPAIGWWIVGLAGIILVLLGTWLFIHYYFAPLPYALRELKKHRSAQSSVILAKEVSKLLKRAAILKFGATKIATLSDETWIRFLSAHAHAKIAPDIIKMIAYSSYLPDNKKSDISAHKIYIAARYLLKNILKDKKHECHNNK